MLKILALAGAALVLAACAAVPAPADDARNVTVATERLRALMVDPDTAALDALVADALSYGHSGGKVDSKSAFIGDLVERRSDFVSIALTEQTVAVAGDTALVRHMLAAATNDGGKPGTVNLKILLVWHKQSGQWRLLARQAVRAP